MNSSYTVEYSTTFNGTSFYLSFLYENEIFLEFEIDNNNVSSEEWKEFVNSMKNPIEPKSSLVIENDNFGKVQLSSYQNTFEIALNVKGCSNASMYFHLVKNESLFKAFEGLSLVLTNEYISDDEDDE